MEVASLEQTPQCLQRQPASPLGTPKASATPAEGDGGGEVLACAVCLRHVTTSEARISVAGGHAHSFVNPHGIGYRIGCFARAVGCVKVGKPESYWSWFPGYRWQIEGCGECGQHLGWLFLSNVHGFHGLILDRLVELEERR